MAGAYYPKIVTDGLVLCLDAASRKSYPGSGLTWNDLSGNGNHGTLVSGPTFSNQNGGYISFDGTNDSITLPPGNNFAYGTGDFTVESWVYLLSYAAAGRAIFTQTVSGTNYFVFGISTSGTIGFRATASGAGTDILGPTVSLNTWNHVVATRTSGNVTLYVNGVPGTSTSNTTNLTNTTYVPTIGNYTHTNNQVPFHGYISHIRVYKGRGFLTSDVTQNFNAARGRFGI